MTDTQIILLCMGLAVLIGAILGTWLGGLE